MVDYSEVKYRKGRTENGFGHYVVADYNGVKILIQDNRTTYPIGQRHLQQICDCVLDEMFGELYESKARRKQYVEENGIRVDFDVGENDE